jgi:DNA-binding transcriptional regulator YiaG
MIAAPMTVVETAEFMKEAARLMSDWERAELIAFVGANPEAGEIIPGTGGVRKIRWSRQGMGKRGGARVIYYYHNERLPLFPLSAYAKSSKANLSKVERNEMKRLVPGGGIPEKGHRNDMTKKTSRLTARKAPRKRQTVGGSIIEGLKQAIAWTRGENDNVRVTLVHVPEVDVRKVRTKMGLSQAQFATKFGFPPATLRNWEQGRSRPDAPTRVLLAVIAKHPEAVEDVLQKAS